MASAMFCPCETRTSTCRNFATISSGLWCFLGIWSSLMPKDILQVGPLQRGRITSAQRRAGDLGAHSTSTGESRFTFADYLTGRRSSYTQEWELLQELKRD